MVYGRPSEAISGLDCTARIGADDAPPDRGAGDIVRLQSDSHQYERRGTGQYLSPLSSRCFLYAAAQRERAPVKLMGLKPLLFPGPRLLPAGYAPSSPSQPPGPRPAFSPPQSLRTANSSTALSHARKLWP